MYVSVMHIQNYFIQTHIEHERYIGIIKTRRILVDMLIDIAPDVYGT